jgi:hypothetical protein
MTKAKKHTPIPPTYFGEALMALREGHHVRRECWNDKELTLALIDGHVVEVYANGCTAEWHFGAAAVMASDWIIIPKEEQPNVT